MLRVCVAETCSSDLSSHLNYHFQNFFPTTCPTKFNQSEFMRHAAATNICKDALSPDVHECGTCAVKRNPTKQIITDVTIADGRRMPVPVFVMSAAPTVRGCIGRYICLLHLRQQVPGISLHI